jgi:hypothetical protein
MYYIHKQGFTIKNGKLEKKYNVQMKKNNEGYNIVGYDNNKIINKSVRFKNKVTTNKNKVKINKTKTNKVKTNKKKGKPNKKK